MVFCGIYEEKQSHLFEASFGIELKNPIEFKSEIVNSINVILMNGITSNSVFIGYIADISKEINSILIRAILSFNPASQ